MPAHRPGNTPVHVRRYDVAAHDPHVVPNFVRHAALCPEDVPVHPAGAVLRVTHMVPPLEVGGDGPGPHVLGTVPLTEAEANQIDTRVVEIAAELAAQRLRGPYVVRPHAVLERAGDGTVVFQQYSCAGFVIELFREVEIDLLATDEARLPPVTLQTLLVAYPDQARALQLPRARQAVGLDGDGPWPVVLVGYLFNALARREDEIRAGPYPPAPGDECFPPRRIDP